MARVRVEKSNPPETKVILAEAIVRIGSAMKAMRDSGLNEDAIVVLVHDKTHVSRTQIRTVFDALRQLEGWYCR